MRAQKTSCIDGCIFAHLHFSEKGKQQLLESSPVLLSLQAGGIM